MMSKFFIITTARKVTKISYIEPFSEVFRKNVFFFITICCLYYKPERFNEKLLDTHGIVPLIYLTVQGKITNKITFNVI